MPDYQVDLADLGRSSGLGAVLLDDVLGRTGAPGEEARPLTITRTLNGPGGIELALPLYAQETTDYFRDQEGKRELHVYRDGALRAGTRMWRSEVQSLSLVRFFGQGWFSSLAKREITDKKLYLPSDPATGNPVVASDQVNIAWDLIDYTQSKLGGGLGITRTGTNASNATGVRRHAAYCPWELHKISEAITELASALDGFDFDISPAKVWRTYYPRRGTDRTASVVFDAAGNISDLGLITDAFEDTVSEFRGLGPCKECDGDTRVVTVSNDNSRADFGLLQDSEHWEIKDQAHLTSNAREQLRLRKKSRRLPSIIVPTDPGSPVWGTDYDVGDLVTVQASEGFATFSAPYRVIGIKVDVSTGGNEDVTVELDAAVDLDDQT